MKLILGGAPPGTGTTCSTSCPSGRDVEILNCNGTCIAMKDQYVKCSDPEKTVNCELYAD